MLLSRLRFSAVFVFLCFASATVSAQQVGGETTEGGAAGFGTGASQLEAVDPDEVFQDVERGATVGATTETGTGFSDVSVATGPGAGGGGGLGGLGGFGGFGGGGLGALGNLFGGFGGAGAQATQPIIRTRLRSAIDVPPTPPAVVQRIATNRFRSLSSRPELRGINVTMQGRTAVISGVVSSERNRRMSELLMRLEPGVSNVDNQVRVAQ